MDVSEPSFETDRFAYAVIGAAIEVHRHLGPGFLEAVYEEALAHELGLRKIPCARQVAIELGYKGHTVGRARLDILVGGRLVVEVKSVESFAALHVAQILSYLKMTGHELALLINFNVPQLRDGIRRLVRTSQ